MTDKVVIGNATLYLGDCLDLLADPAVSAGVDVMITDPPYSSGGYQESGKNSGSIGTKTDIVIAQDTLSTRSYMRMMSRVYKSVRCREFYVFTDWKMWTYCCDALEDGFVRVRSMIVWDKGTPGMGVGWRGQHELIAYGLRGKSKIGEAGQGNVLRYNRSGNDLHPTQKPLAVVEALVRGSEGNVVIDPMMGSGTTGEAALRYGKKFIGIEYERRWFDVACERMDQVQRQQQLRLE